MLLIVVAAVGVVVIVFVILVEGVVVVCLVVIVIVILRKKEKNKYEMDCSDLIFQVITFRYKQLHSIFNISFFFFLFRYFVYSL